MYKLIMNSVNTTLNIAKLPRLTRDNLNLTIITVRLDFSGPLSLPLLLRPGHVWDTYLSAWDRPKWSALLSLTARIQALIIGKTFLSR